MYCLVGQALQNPPQLHDAQHDSPHKGAAVLGRTRDGIPSMKRDHNKKIRNPQPTVPAPSDTYFNILVTGAAYKL